MPDGVIDVFDLIALINCWGEVVDPACEPGDITGPNGVPDGTIAMVNAWGPCSTCDTECPPRTVQDCWDRYSDDMQRYETCLDWVAEQGDYYPEPTQ